MEGEFKIYKGFFKRWENFSFILSENVITYFKNKKLYGKMHWKISNIVDKKGTNIFKICNGINTIKIKCSDIKKKELLVDFILKEKRALQKEELEIRMNNNLINNKIEDFDNIKDDINNWINDNSIKKLTKILNLFWDDIASFNDNLSSLLSKIVINDDIKVNTNSLILISNKIRNNISKSLKLIDKEKEKFKILINYFSQIDNKKSFFKNFNDNKDKIIKSIINEKDKKFKFKDIDENQYMSNINNSSYLFMSHNKTINNYNSVRNIKINDRISNLINNNPVYINYPLNFDKDRSSLPVLLPEKESNSLIKLLKNLIGKDLTRIALPVYLNEPLSFLQKIGEIFIYFDEIQKKILSTNDEDLQMIYMMGISYIQYSHTINKLKKPFNPLLGEIYQMNIESINMKVIMEQVSHHPPISAFYAENEYFKIEGYTQVFTNLSFKGFDVTPKGPMYITNKKNNTKYLILRANSSVHNFLFGKTYVWHSGDMKIINLNSKKKIIINLEKNSFLEKNRHFTAKGEVKDDNDKIIYELEGKWSNFLNAIDKTDNNKVINIIKKQNNIENDKRNYYMLEKVINFNYLNNQMLEKICPNDSRLRPDQRALEHQDIDLATIQKNKLEISQRKRKKARDLKKEQYIPKFFKKIDNDWVYKGNYFKHYEDGDWDLLENIYEDY